MKWSMDRMHLFQDFLCYTPDTHVSAVKNGSLVFLGDGKFDIARLSFRQPQLSSYILLVIWKIVQLVLFMLSTE